MSQLNPLRCEKNDLIKLVNTVAVKNGWGNICNEQILKDLERKGLPINKIGSKKYYSIFELAVFLLMRYTAKSGNMIDKYKAMIIDEVMK